MKQGISLSFNSLFCSFVTIFLKLFCFWHSLVLLGFTYLLIESLKKNKYASHSQLGI